jgi:hypothetical protein
MAVTVKITVFLRGLLDMFIYIRVNVIFVPQFCSIFCYCIELQSFVVHILPDWANKVKVK